MTANDMIGYALDGLMVMTSAVFLWFFVASLALLSQAPLILIQRPILPILYGIQQPLPSRQLFPVLVLICSGVDVVELTSTGIEVDLSDGHAGNLAPDFAC